MARTDFPKQPVSRTEGYTFGPDGRRYLDSEVPSEEDIKNMKSKDTEVFHVGVNPQAAKPETEASDEKPDKPKASQGDSKQKK